MSPLGEVTAEITTISLKTGAGRSEHNSLQLVSVVMSGNPERDGISVRSASFHFAGRKKHNFYNLFEHLSHAWKNPGAGPRKTSTNTLITKICCLKLVDTFRTLIGSRWSKHLLEI